MIGNNWRRALEYEFKTNRALRRSRQEESDKAEARLRRLIGQNKEVADISHEELRERPELKEAREDFRSAHKKVAHAAQLLGEVEEELFPFGLD